MTHPGELSMRRYLADEPSLDAAIAEHLRGCAACTPQLDALRAEQAAFQAELPFERFAAGVEKAVRVQRKATTGGAPRRVLLAIAAGLVVVVAAALGLRPEPGTRLKGGDDTAVEFVVSGSAGQRNAAPVELLAAGERVRIGVSGHRYAMAVSIDEAGEVSVIYSEAVNGPGRTWLPDSIEFTGGGREHLVVVASDEPIAPEVVGTQLRERFSRCGSVEQLGTLDVPGVQVHRTFIKP